MYSKIHGRPVHVGGFPDPRVVKCAINYLLLYPSLIWPGHTGVDMDTAYEPYGRTVPLYALPGKIIAISTIDNPNNRYTSYERSGNAVTIQTMEGGAYMVEHMDNLESVTFGRILEVGDVLPEGSHIGFQGWTGTVDPPGPAGTHVHVKMIDDISVPDTELEKHYVDPIPYITGAVLLSEWVDLEPPKTIYRVQVGAFYDRSNAERTLERLKENGFLDAYIKEGV